MSEDPRDCSLHLGSSRSDGSVALSESLPLTLQDFLAQQCVERSRQSKQELRVEHVSAAKSLHASLHPRPLAVNTSSPTPLRSPAPH
eukprot:747314-Hanusia_phi.AAC.12